MNILIGYGGVLVLFLLIVFVLERSRRAKATTNFSEYATAGRSFGSFYSTMAFVNTWLPGTIFISFAGLAASSGLVGYYFVPYSLIAVLLMFFLAKPVHMWGKKFDLRTQADLLGFRYGSNSVRFTAAVIGIVASLPWVVLGMQSLTYVFSFLSFGLVPATVAVYIGIAVIIVRQIWTVRFGARGLVVSDMVQGIVAYGIGTVLAVGLIIWLAAHDHGVSEVDPSFFSLPDPGSDLGGLYFFCIVLTGGLGAWSWPDIFIRLFTSKSTTVIRKSAVQAAPIIFFFGTAVTIAAILASTLPGVAESSDLVWLIAAENGGPIILTLAGLCVIAGTMGNVGGNLQALGTQTANDIVGVVRRKRITSALVGKISVAVLCAVSAIFAIATAEVSNGLIRLALLSYEGIVQLAPTLFLGVFWKRGTPAAAVSAMVTGFVTASILAAIYPTSIPWLEGITPGIAGLFVNVVVYLAVSFIRPNRTSENARIDGVFAHLKSDAGAPQPVRERET
ncbi:sodium:solute symporter family protein [Brevibacterium pigmentatum]|uniref:sodium:solute symporter family protein n=1 Tax=Brevibacterium pigmentatum TaxID=1496080 RepID=UPI0014242526|nr:sodium:solute symporter family protein [Brevibacterium pigmentatum]